MIIVEGCQNHQGNMDLLKKMVESAAQNGGKFFKIQSFFAEDLTPQWRDEYDRIKALELNWDQHREFVKVCESFGIIPMTSVYTTRYLEILGQCGFKYVKIGSPQVTDQELIQMYIAAGFKVIISTGGHKLSDIPRWGPLAGVLHCVSKYPTQPYEANLSRMLEIKRYWPGVAYGFSSHIDPGTNDWDLPLKLASYLGATYLECHFTLSDRDKTKDGPVSIEPWQLKELYKFETLSREEQLEIYPWLGLIAKEQDQKELDLIKKYKTRWSSWKSENSK